MKRNLIPGLPGTTRPWRSPRAEALLPVSRGFAMKPEPLGWHPGRSFGDVIFRHYYHQRSQGRDRRYWKTLSPLCQARNYPPFSFGAFQDLNDDYKVSEQESKFSLAGFLAGS